MGGTARGFFSRLPRGRRLLWLALFCTVTLTIAAAGLRASMHAPPETVLLTDRHGDFLGEIPGEPDGELGFWPVTDIPPRVAAAAIAVEDKYFHLHPGVNPGAIVRAVVQNARSGRTVSGGSTIAMQVARMQDPGPRTVLKKTVEAVTALLLTVRYGREGIMSQYLTIVPYGNRIRGIGYAARKYFGKPVEDLSWAEVAFLAAIPQAPHRMNPYDPVGRARAIKRGSRILELLHSREDLDSNEYDMALRQLATLRPPPLPRRPLNALHAILRLEKAVAVERTVDRLPSPPILKTTLDLKIQDEAAWLALDAIDRHREKGAGNAAIIILEKDSGKVLAWVGSGGYFNQEGSGAIDYTGVKRHTGSTLKPFIFARAMDRSLISTSSILDDILRGPNGVENADHRFLGPLLPRFALANSRNVPASRLFQRLGIEEGYGFFRDLGLHDGSLPSRHYGLGMALGGLPVSLEDLVRAYTALANDGRILDLTWYQGQESGIPERVVSEESARLVTLFLSDSMARLPSFPRMGASEYRFPVAVKTGTSSSFRDAWTIAWSSKYLVAVWLGHPDHIPMNRVSGFKAAAPLVKRIFERLHPESLDGLDDLSFPAPRGYSSARVCSLSGKLPGTACDRVHLEWFHDGGKPVNSCEMHLFMAMDNMNGQKANEKTPSDRVEIRAVTRLPARYAPWLVAAGLAYPGDQGRPGRGIDKSGSELKGGVPVSIRIIDPSEGTTLMLDPETPRGMATLGLVVEVEPPSEQVVWYVDGKPFKVKDYPYSIRWPISRGEHTFKAGIPLTSFVSEPVTITVR